MGNWRMRDAGAGRNWGVQFQVGGVKAGGRGCTGVRSARAETVREQVSVAGTEVTRLCAVCVCLAE